MHKIILITDCFVKSSIVEQKLTNFLDFFGKEFDICLISNSILSQEIQNKVNYYIYDSNNRLFSTQFDDIPNLTIFREFDSFRIETQVSGNQPHGLSVLVNLFNQIEYCKSLGYSHVVRLEIDMSFQSDFIDKVKHHITECFNQSKKGYFYLGDNSAVCQYFLCEIDYFLNNIRRITNESDYKKFLSDTYGNQIFVPAETVFYENLKDKHNDLILKSEIGLHEEFNQTTWNTEVSQSHLDPKFNGCVTQLARIHNTERLVIYSENFQDSYKNRLIKVFLEDGSSYEIIHQLFSKGHWSYNEVPNTIQEIQIFEEGSYVLTQNINQINSLFIPK